jgi:hypothetical protein
MLYRRLEDAREFVAVVLAVGPIVLVVVLEPAEPAAHTFRPTVGADGVAVLAFVVFRRRAVESALRLRRVLASECLSSLK